MAKTISTDKLLGMLTNKPVPRDNLEAGLFDATEMLSALCSSGIYFLMLDDEIVYIGESDCVLHRVAFHLKDKKFNGLKIIPASAGERKILEGMLLQKHKPRYNGQNFRGRYGTDHGAKLTASAIASFIDPDFDKD